METQIPEIAGARLRAKVLALLKAALEESGLKAKDLADRLGVRKSAVSQVLNGNGNMRLNTLADYLLELGFELDVTLCRVGELRVAESEYRAPVHTFLLQSEEPRRVAESHSNPAPGRNRREVFVSPESHRQGSKSLRMPLKLKTERVGSIS
jgi:transcriptional regulator with XRE-family HTH domain